MDSGFDIPWVGGQNTMGGGKNTMDRGVKISWVRIRYTMGSRGQNAMDREIKIPWVGGLIYHL
jgi:hypothetical protein